MMFKFVKSRFAHLLDPHMNSKPSSGSNFEERENKFQESEINRPTLLVAECE